MVKVPERDFCHPGAKGAINRWCGAARNGCNNRWQAVTMVTKGRSCQKPCLLLISPKGPIRDSYPKAIIRWLLGKRRGYRPDAIGSIPTLALSAQSVCDQEQIWIPGVIEPGEWSEVFATGIPGNKFTNSIGKIGRRRIAEQFSGFIR